MPIDQTSERLTAHLRSLSARHPRAWDQVADMRRARKELGDWPAWCYLPLAGAYAIATGGSDALPTPQQAADVATIGALAAWRATQGIYRIDPTLLEDLWATPISGRLPDDLLYQLPEWCLYIETPGQPFAGAWAHLEYDAGDHRTELRLLLDAPGGLPTLLPIILHLGRGGLQEAIQAATEEAERQAGRMGRADLLSPHLPAVAKLYRDIAAPLLSVLLYICSEAAEIRDARGTSRLPKRSAPARTKAGLKEVPAQSHTTWDVGWRIGAALRLAKEHAETGYLAGAHAGPRAHLRRAHWHTYLTGPRTGPQKAVLRWLHPILVGAGDVVPTIHEVE